MKKIISLISVFILSVLFLSGCNSNKKLYINPQYQLNKTIEIYDADLRDMLYEKNSQVEYKDFVLYIYEESCSACAYFENILNSYIKKTNIVIYKISSTQVERTLDTPSKYKTNPRLLFYKQGKLVSQITAMQNEKIFQKYEDLENYLDSKVALSPMYIVSDLSNLNYLYHQNEFVIYLGWDKCYDCQYFEKNFLNSYVKNNKLNNFYYYNTDYYRSQKADNPEVWEAFANTWQFNINENKGRVPTVLYIKDGQVTDYIIYLNDDITVYDDGSVLVHKSSYGTTEPGLNNDSYGSYYEYVKGVENFHNAKANAFMQNHLLKK